MASSQPRGTRRFEVPEESSAEAEEGPAEESRIDQESSLDLGQPSSSSPAPKEPEAWRTWKQKEFPDQTSRQGPPETRTVFLKGRGAGKEGEPYHYNTKEVRYYEACKSLRSSVQDLLHESGTEIHSKSLLGIIKNLTNPNKDLGELTSIRSD